MNRAQSYTINSTFVLALAALALLAPPAAHAQATITVNSTLQVATPGPGGPGVGGNADSLCQLSEAILAANSNLAVDGCTAGSVAGPDTIMVPAGTYTLALVDFIEVSGPSSPLQDLPFGLPRIVSNIIITGVTAANTIIERSTAPGTPNFAFLYIAFTSTLIVNNLTFRNGIQRGGVLVGVPDAGGAIFNNFGAAAALTINNCVFDSNTADSGGGAIFNAATINNSTFTNNTAPAGGGAIALAGFSNFDIFITNSTFSSNNSTSSGGAIFAPTGLVTISHSVFANNNSGGCGGALRLDATTTVSIDASIFSGNQSGGGGAIASGCSSGGLGGSVTISNSAFVNNQTISGQGGAIFANAGSLTVSNSTFSGNTGANVGAIATASLTSLNNVTVVNNASRGVDVSGFGTFSYSNTIIAGNSSFDTVNVGTVTSLGFNLIGDNTSSGNPFSTVASDQAGTGANPIDPVVGLLGANGGTITAGSNVGGQTLQVVPTRALLIGSPALNAGNPAAPTGIAPACEVNSANGLARPQGAACDIGAFENPGGTAIVPTVDVSVTKTDSPDPVLANSNLTYTITVTNNGPDPATGLSLSDPLATGVNFVSLAAPSFWSCTTPAVGANGTITCTKPSLQPGVSEVFTLVATVTGSAVAPVGNTATVTTTGNDASQANNVVTATTAVSGTNVDLSVTKTDSPDPVNVGAVLTYTITVSNAGPGGATAVILTDTLPANVAFGVPTPSQGTCNQAAGIVTCNLGAIANGANATITITVTPGAAAAPSISNTASASAVETDNNPADNSQTISTTVNPLADISVTKTDSPDPVNVNANLTYTITVTNNGPSAAASASLSDALPAGVNFVSLTSPAGWTCITPAVGANGTVSCTNPSVGNGVTGVFTLTVTPTATAAASISNTATVSATTSDPSAANNSQTASTTVNPVADLSVTKTDAPDPVTAGSNLTYTITVNNAGPSSAVGVSLNDTLPAGTTFVSLVSAAGWTCSTPAVGAAGTVTCTLASLASGAPAVFTLVVRTTAAGALNNTATVATTTTDPSAANNSATAGTTVNSAAATDFTITAAPPIQSINPGQSATFTITLTPTPAGALFNNAIQLSVAGELAVGFVSFSQTSVTPGANPANVTMTVTIPPRTGMVPPAPRGPQMPPLEWLLLGAMAMAALVLLARGQRVPRKMVPALALLLLVVGGVLMQSACAQQGNTLSGPKTLTVTATSGALSHSTTVIVNLP